MGTTAPGVKLEVNSGGSDNVARFTSTDARARILISDNNDISYFGTYIGTTFLGPDDTPSGNTINVLSNGNVGIGTTTPDYQLEVENTSSQATVGITGGNTDARLHLKNNEGTWIIQNDYSNTGALSFYNSSHRVVITEGGNVGYRKY